ncbi:MAG: nucleotidyltransferase family protein [Brevefilum sp.]|nr:nucleotidyltransferase family protein [Brevefilum sp.]
MTAPDLTLLLCQALTAHSIPVEMQTDLLQFTLEDWKALLYLADQHNLTPILYQQLRECKQELAIPPEITDRMRRAFLTNAARNTYFLHETGRILQAFSEAGLPAIGLKGVFLLENIYPNVALRSMSDLDLMVEKSDITEALAIIEKLGFHPTTFFDILDKNIDIKHVPPFVKGEGPFLELHWTLLEENEPFSIETDGIWQRAQPAKIAGVDALALSPEDLILHLCIHLTYQHYLTLGLRGLYDIAEVLRIYNSQIDWRTLEEIAHRWGTERVLWLTLALAQELLDAKIPPSLLASRQPQGWVLAGARAQLLERSRRGVIMTPDLAALSTERGLFNRIKLILSRIFLPRRTLARIYNVPPNSIHIIGGYIKRFLDLNKQYGIAARRLLKKDQRMMAGVENEHAIASLRGWMTAGNHNNE